MKLSLILTLSLLSHIALAKITEQDYSALSNLSGYKLKTQLNQLLRDRHITLGYGQLIDIYFESDADHTYEQDGSILDIYSEIPEGHDPYNFNKEKDKCGAYRAESDCFNREHIFPQGVFNKASPMRSDIFHIFPTDGYVNGRRSNHPFGEVQDPHWTSQNGSKLGNNTYGDYHGTVFEPIDAFKGDVARALLYFATRYEHKVRSWHHAMLNGTKDQVYADWFISLLMKWHKMDPVDAHERNRNNVAEKYQGNRNPFIDHPEWVEKIWGNK